MSLDVWFAEDLQRVLQSIALGADSARILPGLEGAAYRAGFAKAVEAMAMAAGVTVTMPWPTRADVRADRLAS